MIGGPGKRVFPAALAALATVVAALVTLRLSDAADAELRDADWKHVPAMALWNQLDRELVRLDVLLRWVGDAESEPSAFARRIEEPESVYQDMDAALSKDGASLLEADEVEALRAALAQYWQDARIDAAAKATGRLELEKERGARRGRRRSVDPSPTERAALARSAAVEDQFRALHHRLEGGAEVAKARIDMAFFDAAKRLRSSLLTGAIILLVGVAAAVGLARWLSRHSRRPVDRRSGVEAIRTQLGRPFEQARTLEDIVESVRDLAVQSHVLSLSASSEARKAVEAGKSFAALAQQVRALADTSGQSAARIADMVAGILTAVPSTREPIAPGGQGGQGASG